ncbi:MAG: 6-pyruvoyl tetrahydropterin synthase family protein [Anaerolineales bacterium]|nr:6-pyruvoyl tetrahydropterin synthase family protein [Anaerolineales bacterium]
MSSFRIRVEKNYLGFSSGHFITYAGAEAETLHGHNYYAAVLVEGELDQNSYVFNFVTLKQLLRAICDRLDHRTLLPSGNPHFALTADEAAYTIRYQHKTYVLPREDVVVLPIPNTTAECLARYVAEQLVAALRAQGHALTSLRAIEVDLEETVGQRAVCRLDLP